MSNGKVARARAEKTPLQEVLEALPYGADTYRTRLSIRGASFRPAMESWSPNFPGELVCINMVPLPDGRWRVCVWGEDDIGMECDVPSRDEAWRIYKSLPVVIWIDDLVSRGFRGA